MRPLLSYATPMILRRRIAEADVHAEFRMFGGEFANAIAKSADPPVVCAVNEMDRPVGAGAAPLFDEMLGDSHHRSDANAA